MPLLVDDGAGELEELRRFRDNVQMLYDRGGAITRGKVAALLTQTHGPTGAIT